MENITPSLESEEKARLKEKAQATINELQNKVSELNRKILSGNHEVERLSATVSFFNNELEVLNENLKAQKDNENHLISTVDAIVNEPLDRIRRLNISIGCDSKTISFIFDKDDSDSFKTLIEAMENEAQYKIKKASDIIPKTVQEITAKENEIVPVNDRLECVLNEIKLMENEIESANSEISKQQELIDKN